MMERLEKVMIERLEDRIYSLTSGSDASSSLDASSTPWVLSDIWSPVASGHSSTHSSAADGSYGGSDLSSFTRSTPSFTSAGNCVHAAKAFIAQRDARQQPNNKAAAEEPNGYVVMSEQDVRDLDFFRAREKQRLEIAATQLPPPQQLQHRPPPGHQYPAPLRLPSPHYGQQGNGRKGRGRGRSN